MKTYTIKEIKEQGIWVKCTGQSAAKLLKAMGAFPAANGQEHDYYKYDKTECWLQRFYKFTDQTPSSYIEFIQIDWEDRKQIGWKLKKECEQYRTAAMKICNDMPFLENYRWNIHTNSVNANTLQSAGVLELWFEPVYEEVKFKVGDWVIADNCAQPTATKIVAIKDGYYKSAESLIDNSFLLGFNIAESAFLKLRLATAEEIKAAEKIEIGGYSVEIHNGSTRISGYEFTKEFWEAALIVSKHQKAKIKIGCSHQFDLPTETIERILSKLK